MCLDPVSIGFIASAGLSTVQGVAESRARSEQAQAQADAIGRETEQRLVQEDIRATAKATQIKGDIRQQRLARLRERATLSAQIGSSGVSGKTPIRQKLTSFIQEGIEVGNLQENLESTQAATLRNRGITVANARSQFKSVKKSVGSKFLNALNIVGGGLGSGLNTASQVASFG